MKSASIYTFLGYMMLIATIHAKEDPKIFIDTLYTAISGYDLPAGEADEMSKCDGAPTYGEILPESLEKLLQELNVTKKDVFIDLGCGVGKAATQVYWQTPVRKSVGIELSKTRYDKAQGVKTELQNQNKLDKSRQLEFQNKNIIDADLSDGTIVFMCSTCFSESLMKAILDKLLVNKNKNLRVVTLKQLPNNDRFTLQKTLTLPMTWSNGTQVHIYTVK